MSSGCGQFLMNHVAAGCLIGQQATEDLVGEAPAQGTERLNLGVSGGHAAFDVRLAESAEESPADAHD